MSDDSGINFYIEAAKRGNEEQIDELLKQPEYTIASVDGLGNTALHWAASGGHSDCVKYLLGKKIALNAQNQNGDTALHKAVWRHHAETCKLIVDAGADVEIVNHDGKCPYAIARDADIKRIVAPPLEMAEDDECDEDSD
uniref:Uncharacterized protein n=1 Tax=Paramoeba aestuarina TaxID=180227 RepID=A0A7S4KPJ4_9EUKA|mmetsp:Transcript_22800/g.35471  ORF Transcript_22800/g.35471 Transcript_22800/m.35471 type:complete len:140 (+) Transcript_22800:72-491(+)|eukprot:CAMPEP_0201507376 /NCGR_PEP_ID=MMETSP0161_2-20130828/1052_1 /ASSEMBLY_ACC=CAM_ASM_000251 /TAXON_ID=180227 /ORGANISM="Neoparamoeba aestuarina, Strain SoJaBio B1-5/56/2" /LENGTH=139 /DNA_ID=CAMNT_0047901717 /DNA_START=67 /DNA_END=486 /DNA_ORIENTATION=+